MYYTLVLALPLCAYAAAPDFLGAYSNNLKASNMLFARLKYKKEAIANHAQIFPLKNVDPKAVQQAARESTPLFNESDRSPIIIPLHYTATDMEKEQRLSYFREDIGINLHHWHWHLVYPNNATDKATVSKDRRGELFAYMHQQIVARYNNERFCNSLKRVKKFNNFREPIPEAYYPMLDNRTSSREWPPREANMQWQDLNRPFNDLNVTIADMERWRRNVEEAIATGTVQLPKGTYQPLTIDMLGNMVQASLLSPNPQLYGNIHNNGHSLSGCIHDPYQSYPESLGVMADEATAMRDPFFYRWHAWIDELFQSFKESPYVSRYSRIELENPGVEVRSVTVENIEGGGADDTLNTFWTQSDLNLSRGLDFAKRKSVFTRFTHLDHRRYRYVIKVNNTGTARWATVRIFLAPKQDDRNLVNSTVRTSTWLLSNQRQMFIEMDRFVVPLNSGHNTINRKSVESSVTIPFEQTFRDLSEQGDDPNRGELANFNFCGCGWPQHMLVPKGTEAGAPFQLFVMLSNYDLDMVEQPDGTELSCKKASSFCGLKDKLYPDRRPMGFPFDRPSIVTSIEDFILPNMALTDITIHHQHIIERNPKNALF